MIPLFIQSGFRGKIALRLSRFSIQNVVSYEMVLFLSRPGKIVFRTRDTECNFEEEIKPYFIQHDLKEFDVQVLFNQVKPILLNLNMTNNKAMDNFSDNPLVSVTNNSRCILDLDKSEFISYLTMAEFSEYLIK